MPTPIFGSALPDPYLLHEDIFRVRSDVIVYLDFDGVLNRKGTAELPIEWCHPVYENNGPHDGFEPECLELVDLLCHSTGASVVLTTSWVGLYGVNGCREVLRHFGFKAPIIGTTPRRMSGYSRAYEIRRDLENRKPLRYAILDDKFNKHTDLETTTLPEIADFMVFTHPDHGFTRADYVVAERLLMDSSASNGTTPRKQVR